MSYDNYSYQEEGGPKKKTKNAKTTAKPTSHYGKCLVCGDKSSGVHYGVMTCEGCKGFYRRSLNEKSDIMSRKCYYNRNCEINVHTRNRCQYCRLTKCFSVGMSKSAAKLGRRSKKMKDEMEEMIRRENIKFDNPSDSHLTQQPEETNVRMPSFKCSSKDDFYEEESHVEQPKFSTFDNYRNYYDFFPQLSCAESVQNITDPIIFGMVDSNNSRFFPNESVPYGEEYAYPTQESEKTSLIHYMISVVDMNTYNSFPVIFSNNFDYYTIAQYFINNFMDVINIHQEKSIVYKQMFYLVDESFYYQDFNYIRNSWLNFQNFFTNNIGSIIRFSKLLPGFSMMHIDDQVYVIKKSAIDIFHIIFSLCIKDSDTIVYSLTNTGFILKKDFVKTLPFAQGFIDSIVQLSNVICQFHLNFTEYALFCASLAYNFETANLKFQSILIDKNEIVSNLSNIINLHGGSPTVYDTLVSTILPLLGKIRVEHKQMILGAIEFKLEISELYSDLIDF